MRKEYTFHSQEEKLAIVKRYLSGESRFQFRYWQTDDLAKVVSDAISYFNTVRPVRKLNGKSSVQLRIEQVA